MSSLSNSRRSDELGGVTSKMTPPSNHSSINDSKRTTPQTPQSSHNVPMRFKSAVPENLSLTSSVDSLESLSHRSNDNINNTARRTDSGRILTPGRITSSNFNRAKDDSTQKLSAKDDSSNRSSGSNYDRKKYDGEYKSNDNNNNNNRIDSSSSNGHRSNNLNSNNNSHHSSSNTNTAKMTYNINKNNTVSKPGILTSTEADDRHRFKRAYNTPMSLEENAAVAVYREREIKVFEASNDERKMPVIPEHQNWLLNREVEMKKKEEEYLRSVVNGKINKDISSSSKNSSSKDGKKVNNTNDTTQTKDNNNNSKPSSANSKATNATSSGKPGSALKKGTSTSNGKTATTDTQLQQSSSSAKLPYTLAAEFMTSQFPSFAVNQNQQRQQQELQLLQSQQVQQHERERKSKHLYDSKDDDSNGYNQNLQLAQQQQHPQPESESILHQRQIKECQSIMKAFEKQQLSAPNSSALMNALVLPQDLPDVISVGQLKMNAMCLTEKLMNNPLPVEFLRTNKLLKSVNTGKKGKKKKTAATV